MLTNMQVYRSQDTIKDIITKVLFKNSIGDPRSKEEVDYIMKTVQSAVNECMVPKSKQEIFEVAIFGKNSGGKSLR